MGNLQLIRSILIFQGTVGQFFLADCFQQTHPSSPSLCFASRTDQCTAQDSVKLGRIFAAFGGKTTAVGPDEDARRHSYELRPDVKNVDEDLTSLERCENDDQEEIAIFSVEFQATVENDRMSEQLPPKESRRTEGWISEVFGWYIHFLGTHALLTKCMTSGIVGGIGDLCAQLLSHRTSPAIDFNLDFRRLFGIIFECTCLSSPLMHFAYDFLERIVPIHNEESSDGESKSLGDAHQKSSQIKIWGAATFHVLADTFLLGPIYVLSMMVTSSIFEGRIRLLKRDLILDFIPTFKASVWSSLGFMPMQILAFRVLPSEFKLLYMNFQDIAWNGIVSFVAHKSRY